MAEIEQTQRVAKVLSGANAFCKGHRHEFLMPEHVLRAMIEDFNFNHAFNIFYDPLRLVQRLEEFFATLEQMPGEEDYEAGASCQMIELITAAMLDVQNSSAERLDITHLTRAMLDLEDSWAAYLLHDCLLHKEANFLSQLVNFCEFDDMFPNDTDKTRANDTEPEWKSWVSCMNDHYESHNRLIGRERELKRTIEVLCRLDKNNPLHVGESGVGKTALVWGLARLIEEGKVPPRLKGSRIYQLDMGTLVAGTQYRGEFENRIKLIMDGIVKEGDNNILYIDEIHTLVGAGATSGGALDASNMLKPYLEGGTIRFIGATTYDEYNRHFSRSKGLMRRFQQIDIVEPSVEEAIHILMQLKPRYEDFHGVKYDDDAIEFAVRASAKHINDRFLPDKALDLIDEAGAAMELNEKPATIGKKEIADVLAKTCKVDALAEAEDDDYRQLEDLAARMLSQIYGQDEAIRQVVESVQMARAGLLDDNKPLASLLFVGPTGVGKTEVARVLARELGIELVRFDMSEYTERHAVAKLIGSPAGYVGYEDGGLLTDAIRKTPNCVLLLDEIEKAHQDIYNILLQVMDYA
ncbi:MAG: AAA family ATPase, partial [Muribaculaceae bacterium]|nr:AAA family ATPase [Muribaculaceae bacterium]